MSGQTHIAVIGLGSMGLGMARSLVRAGYSVAGCDVSE
ncbi:NAD(P)-binding domain-containing protein [Mesorhizobium sp. YR577]|nr:NAD binding domain of 6-phosphogluconate dehydrogenase [Mesorhizobium sp. YR577]